MDLFDIIDSFSTSPAGVPYTVTRRAAATYTAGRAVLPTPTTFTIEASVQAASGRDLLRLPEGRRATETRVLYTTTQLFAGAQGGTNEADRITIDGVLWEVQHVETWVDASIGDLQYYRCVVQRREGVA